MDENTIYLVTTLQFADPTRNLRCIGYYFDLEDALKLVKNNGMDIAEDGYYRFAVIEEKGEGCYTTTNGELWFKYDREEDRYVECNKPEKLHHVVCFGIG